MLVLLKMLLWRQYGAQALCGEGKLTLPYGSRQIAPQDKLLPSIRQNMKQTNNALKYLLAQSGASGCFSMVFLRQRKQQMDYPYRC